MANLMGMVNRFMGGRRAAGGGMGARRTAGGGMGATGGMGTGAGGGRRAQDEAIGRGVRGVLSRFRR